jgi:hypothetical protein
VSENHADPGSWLIALPISMALLVEDPNYHIQSKFLVFYRCCFKEVVRGGSANLIEATITSWHYTSIRDQQPHHAQKQCEHVPK